MPLGHLPTLGSILLMGENPTDSHIHSIISLHRYIPANGAHTYVEYITYVLRLEGTAYAKAYLLESIVYLCFLQYEDCERFLGLRFPYCVPHMHCRDAIENLMCYTFTMSCRITATRYLTTYSRLSNAT